MESVIRLSLFTFLTNAMRPDTVNFRFHPSTEQALKDALVSTAKKFYSEERFWKVVFSVAGFIGYEWTQGQPGGEKISSRFPTKTDIIGQVQQGLWYQLKITLNHNMNMKFSPLPVIGFGLNFAIEI